MNRQAAPDEELVSRFGLLGGVDEVGRGAIAGPLAVGLVVTDGTAPAPKGLTDSKLLSPAAREALVEPIGEWSVARAVGWASPTEVTSLGVFGALAAATNRALDIVSLALARHGCPPLGVLLIDGNFDWMSQQDLLAPAPSHNLEILTRVKADQTSNAVSAASIIAKVARDDYMSEIPDAGYGWSGNKGYGTKRHVAAMRRLGLSAQHRRGWKVRGLA